MKSNAANKFTIDELRARLRHDPDTGFLYWRERPRSAFASDRAYKLWKSACEGKRALASRRHSGHLGGNIDGKFIFAHVAIWALHCGVWPTGEIDHIDGDPANNLIENLRDVSHAENMRNQRITKSKGRVGVMREKRGKGWWAQIGSVQYLGTFPTYEEACAAREKAERELGYHENHGRRS